MVSARSYLCNGSRCQTGTGNPDRDAALGGSTGSQLLTSPRRRASLARLRHWEATSRPRPPPFARCRRVSSPPCAARQSERTLGSAGSLRHWRVHGFERSRRSHLGERILAGAQVEPKLVCSLELGHSKSLSHRLAERIEVLRSPIRAHAWAAASVAHRPGPLASRNWKPPGVCALKREDEKEPHDARRVQHRRGEGPAPRSHGWRRLLLPGRNPANPNETSVHTAHGTR